jgi:PAS domain S-box-containing protein
MLAMDSLRQWRPAGAEGGKSGKIFMISESKSGGEACLPAQTGQAVLASEIRYRRLFEAAQDGILILDYATGQITDANPFLIKLLGFSHAEMVGHTVGELSPFRDIVSNQIMLERLRADGYVRYEDLPLKTRDGRAIAVEFVSNVYEAGGEKVIQCNIRDITARKQAAQQVTLLNSCVANLNEMVVITRAEPVTEPGPAIVFVNAAFERITGYTSAEALGRSPRFLQGKNTDRRVLAEMHRALEQRQPIRRQVLNYHKNGAEYWVDMDIVPVFDTAGKCTNFVAIERDVTTERKHEARLRETQKMESIGQLAGGIAHDFNNILMALTANIYLMKSAATVTPEALEHLESMTEATQRASDLVNQILTFSRRNKPEREPTHLNDVVLEALKLLRASLPVSIRIQTELTETPTVLANPSAIHQVIMNLGTNAWHAMRPHPGVLKVDMKSLEADVDFVKTHPDLTPGKYVLLSVSDSGCGMDRATQERVFEPFFTTKAVGEGTGLGLSVVHGIMRAHEGAVSVYSQPGQGSTFHLYFPVFLAKPVVRETATVPIPRGRGQQILLVDDEAVLARLGKQVLEQLGYRVTATTSAVEAIAAVREAPDAFDLVITDLTMPVMDGISLGRQLRLLQPSLPMILTTGYSGTLTTANMIEIGFQELMDKPVNARTLGETVARVLGKAGRMSQSKNQNSAGDEETRL